MKILKTRRSKVVTAAACGLALGLGGIASAYWTAGGTTGTGTAAVANPTALPVVLASTGTEYLNTVTHQAVLNSTFYPDGPALTSLGTISNPNDFPVPTSATTPPRIVSVTVDKAGCNVADFRIAPGTLGYVEGVATIPAHGSVSFATSNTVQLVNTESNQDACKGATVTLTYALP